ncbi:contractile injection system tape measure protein [Aquimarina sp. M1]
MNSQKHIINKVFFEVNTSDTKTAYYLKDNLDMFLKQQLLPTLEAYFDSLTSKGNQIIRFDTLELNISSIEVKDQVQLQLDIIKSLQKQVLSYKGLKTSKIEGVSFSVMDKGKSDVETFFYYLKTGQNPWWDTKTDFGTIEFIDTIVFNNDFQLKFKESLSNKRTRQRLIYQFSDEVLVKIISQNRLPKPFPKTLAKKEIREYYWEIITKYISDGSTIAVQGGLATLFTTLKEELNEPKIYKVVNRILKETIKQICKREDEHNPKLQKSTSVQESLVKDLERILFVELKLLQNLKEKDLEDKVYSQLKPQLKKHIDAGLLHKIISISVRQIHKKLKEKTNKSEQEIIAFTSLLISEKSEVIQNDPPKFSDTEEYKKENVQFQKEETIESDPVVYIDNAGLLLLHPYLNKLFTELDLLNKEGEIKPNKVELSIHVLHYLATKKERQPESKLVFEKFLCGFPIDKPIRKNISIPQNFKEEADSLLESVLTNWQVLKNTSADGLRENFIKRAGKLILDDTSKYRIIVERKTQDILLEKLPWNLTIVKLPWIDRLIFVEW